jgi:glucose-6-phosphate 1-dehydrogenase
VAAGDRRGLSARPSIREALNAQILKVLSEDQIYRIDTSWSKRSEYLGVFANGIFEPLWNRDHIDHVTLLRPRPWVSRPAAASMKWRAANISAEPSVQLLAMIGMEPPISFNANAVRAKRPDCLRRSTASRPRMQCEASTAAGWCSGRKF